jgi:hypothetical protein
MSGYALHPDAFADFDEIWEYIPQDTSTLLTRYSHTSTRPSAPSWLHHTSDIDAPP